MTRRGAYGLKKLPVPDSLGARIRTIRVRWGWSQVRLAEAIGSDQRTLSSWERDRYPVPGPALTLLATLFQQTEAALVHGKGFKIPDPPMEGTAELPIPYLALPPQAEPGVWLIDRMSGAQVELTPTEVRTTLREARESRRRVWIVLG